MQNSAYQIGSMRNPPSPEISFILAGLPIHLFLQQLNPIILVDLNEPFCGCVICFEKLLRIAGEENFLNSNCA